MGPKELFYVKRKRAFDRYFPLPYDALADENIASWKLKRWLRRAQQCQIHCILKG